jgi:integrase
MRIHVRRRSYKGQFGLPKSNKPREIVLPPPAREALLTLPRTNHLIFIGKRGQLISQATLSGYWSLIEVAFGRQIDPYELRHFGAHHLYVRMNLPARVVAVQMGHSEPRLVERLYGHGEIGALEEIDRAFGSNVHPLRRAGGAHGT